MARDLLREASNISVVVPAYNAQQWLDRAIASVLHQTARLAEIIVIDDGSTDQTADVVRKHAAAIRYFHQQNSGPSAARNRGIHEARSEWIAFLDADDEWLPHKTESQLDILEKNPDLRWCGSACEIVGPGREASGSPSAGMTQKCARHTELRYFPALLKRVRFITSGFVIRRSVFDELGGFDPELRSGEDVDMWCRIAMKHPRIGYCSDPCWYYYQENPDSACRRGRVHRDLPLRNLCKNIHRAMELGPEVADDFRGYAKMRAMDDLLRLAARDCLIEADTLEEVRRVFPLGVSERALLGILRRLPRFLALRLVRRLRDRISL